MDHKSEETHLFNGILIRYSKYISIFSTIVSLSFKLEELEVYPRHKLGIIFFLDQFQQKCSMYFCKG